MSPRRPGQSPLSARQATLSVLLALLAAASYSLFDVGLQFSGASLGAEPFLSTMFILVGLLSCLLLPWTDSLARLKSLQAVRPVALTAILIAGQAVLICYALGRFGDATRVNIVYALRGLWSVLLAWLLDRLAASPEGRHAPRVLLYRLLGAAILLACVILAML